MKKTPNFLRQEGIVVVVAVAVASMHLPVLVLVLPCTDSFPGTRDDSWKGDLLSSYRSGFDSH